MHFSVLMIVKRAEDLRGFGFVMAVSSCGLYVLRIARFRGVGNGKHFAGRLVPDTINGVFEELGMKY